MNACKFTIKERLLALFIVCFSVSVQAQDYQIRYIVSAKDTMATALLGRLQKNFASRQQASAYLEKLPETFLDWGYAAASVDSIEWRSSSANIYLFAGERYSFMILADSLRHLPLVFKDLQPVMHLEVGNWEQLRESLLRELANQGYPFAKVGLKQVQIDAGIITGRLLVEAGKYYVIDSIRVHGRARISRGFLEQYLNIGRNSAYSREKLEEVGPKLDELTFVEAVAPWNLSMLSTGAVLNLYLEPKRNSSADVLIGLLPRDPQTGKTKISADVNLNLKNAFAGGESIMLNWQQLQPASPRLYLGWQQPYLFRSPLGTMLDFELFKKDSLYLQIGALAGVTYRLSANTTASVFLQTTSRYLLEEGFDSLQVIRTKKLPPWADVRTRSAGVEITNTRLDYRFNPRRGRELLLRMNAGTKEYRKNEDIVALKDEAMPDFNFESLYDSLRLKSYDVSIQASGALFTPLARRAVFLLKAQGALRASEHLFRNELFRIGGYRLLRGFDDESIFASRYAVATVEYRLLTGKNSYVFVFSDAAITKTKTINSDFSNTFLSGGAGIEMETKMGLLNLSYAMGKRNDVKFDLRSASRIHFGYINYF